MEEKKKRLPCVKGFASVRSTLAGVAETGSETAQRLEGCKKQSLSRLAPTAPFTQRSLKTLHKLPNNQSFFCLLFFSKKSTVKEKYGQRKAGYFFGVLILERGLARTASSSEALLTCVYICVVLSCSCPRISLSASTSTPPS